jgi:pimeloyl-ACP methyl ester carboxylesterase
MKNSPRIVCLPGAAGAASFWQPVSSLLAKNCTSALIGWPGHAGAPSDPTIRGLPDLATLVLAKLDRPSALLAQSMGGVVAMLAALRRPDLVTHLVLVATSGGINIADLQAASWRESFAIENPSLPRWFVEDATDLTSQVSSISCPTLLLWGDTDPMSPVSVGRRLAGLLPNSRLRVFQGGGHDLVSTHSHEVAVEISHHLFPHAA